MTRTGSDCNEASVRGFSTQGHDGETSAPAEDVRARGGSPMDSGGDRICPGSVFGSLPKPRSVECMVIHATVGPLTAIHRQARGTAKGTALFVPGFTGSKEDFYDLFPLLGDLGWDCWAISQRGQGDSVAPAGPCAYGRRQTAADVCEVAGIIGDHVGRERIHLLGHSFGGTVAQAAAIADHSRFASLTLMSSGPHGWPGRKADLRQRLLDHPGGDLWRLDNPDRASVADEDLDPDERFFRTRSEHTGHDQLIGAIDQLADVHDTTEEIRQTHLPCLIFHGVHDNQAWPQEWQRRTATLLDARYEIIDDAGHCPNNDNPAATARLLDDFWMHVPPLRP